MIDPARVIVVGDPPVARSSEEVATPTSITPPLAVSAYDSGGEGRVGHDGDVESGGQRAGHGGRDRRGAGSTIAFGNGKSATAPLPPVAIAFEVPSFAGGAMVDSGWPDGASSRPQFDCAGCAEVDDEGLLAGDGRRDQVDLVAARCGAAPGR